MLSQYEDPRTLEPPNPLTKEKETISHAFWRELTLQSHKAVERSERTDKSFPLGTLVSIRSRRSTILAIVNA